MSLFYGVVFGIPVAYQIKGNEAYNNILAHICPYTPLAPGGVNSRKKFFESCQVAYQIKGKEV